MNILKHIKDKAVAKLTALENQKDHLESTMANPELLKNNLEEINTEKSTIFLLDKAMISANKNGIWALSSSGILNNYINELNESKSTTQNSNSRFEINSLIELTEKIKSKEVSNMELTSNPEPNPNSNFNTIVEPAANRSILSYFSSKRVIIEDEEPAIIPCTFNKGKGREEDDDDLLAYLNRKKGHRKGKIVKNTILPSIINEGKGKGKGKGKEVEDTCLPSSSDKSKEVEDTCLPSSSNKRKEIEDTCLPSSSNKRRRLEDTTSYSEASSSFSRDPKGFRQDSSDITSDIDLPDYTDPSDF